MKNFKSKEDEIDFLKEKVFDLNEENNNLRKQITYLQEELSLVEDEKAKSEEKLNQKISLLEIELGEALFGKNSLLK